MINKKCLICKKDFSVKNYRKDTAKFCSYKCSAIHSGKKRAVNKLRHCKWCKKSFDYTYKTQKFCSYNCYWNSMEENHIVSCKNCKVKFKSWKSEKKQFCSRSCTNKFISGKNHHNWKGGFIDIQGYKIIYINGKRYTEHRYFVEQHFGYKLTIEHIHHINGIKTDNRLENLYLFPNNKSHIKFHMSKVKIELKSNII